VEEVQEVVQVPTVCMGWRWGRRKWSFRKDYHSCNKWTSYRFYYWSWRRWRWRSRKQR
jgi:hypothetical protein